MKVLFDCFSCSPYYGSDEQIGWVWPYYMRKYHEVWAVVRSDRREGIERYCHDNGINDIHFIYADIPNWLNFYYKHLKEGKNKTIDFLFYQWLWQYASYHAASKVNKSVHFDLVHKVGTNDFRILGKMYKLHIPYIIGPIGGAQKTPESLEYYTRNYNRREKVRSLLNAIMSKLPGYKSALNQATKIYFSNKETMAYLFPKIKNQDKCEIMTEVGWNGELPCLTTSQKNHEIFTFLWAGRMEYRKGLELLFDVLEHVKSNNWQLLLCGDGANRKEYQKIVSKKSYANRIKFLGKISYQKMNSVYEQADVFLFPSIRETTGTVIIEAMAHALPVVALNQGGAVEVVKQDCGFLIDGKSKNEIINRFVKVFDFCIDNPSILETYGNKARKRIEEKYIWSTKVENMSLEYYKIIKEYNKQL